MRRTSSLACWSSRSWPGGTSGTPRMCLRVRTTGGPPSGEESERMKRPMENVLHGGAAITARNSPDAARRSRAWKNESLSKSCVSSPSFASLSTITASSPNVSRKDPKPSARRYGPEKSARTFREVGPAPRRDARASASWSDCGRDVAGGRGTRSLTWGAASSPVVASRSGGGVGATSPTRRSSGGRRGMNDSSK